jgi:hypothetical protein
MFTDLSQIPIARATIPDTPQQFDRGDHIICGSKI